MLNLRDSGKYAKIDPPSTPATLGLRKGSRRRRADTRLDDLSIKPNAFSMFLRADLPHFRPVAIWIIVLKLET